MRKELTPTAGLQGEEKPVLDPCCSSRMFWFDKKDTRTVFTDIRNEQHTLCDGRALSIEPDFIADVTNLPFESETFWHVVLDPPHLKNVGDDAYMALKYGKLPKDIGRFIGDAYNECWRVLKDNGTLVFKWNEDQIKVSDILRYISAKPLYGHKSGKNSKTHWIVFIKLKS